MRFILTKNSKSYEESRKETLSLFDITTGIQYCLDIVFGELYGYSPVCFSVLNSANWATDSVPLMYYDKEAIQFVENLLRFDTDYFSDWPLIPYYLDVAQKALDEQGNK